MNNDQTSVDVVIPSYRPDEKFSRLVKKLQEQEYPIGTIFVINTKAGRFPKEVDGNADVKGGNCCIYDTGCSASR